MASDKRMRRSPQQARGQRRVTKILDAAAEIFAEVGYEEATTNAIAIRANTSIGSLYQFFPNKLAILNALAHRYRTSLNSQLRDGFEQDMEQLHRRLSSFIDLVAGYYAAHPAFQPMFYASQSSRELSDIANETGSLLVEHVSAMFREALPTLAPQQAESCATIVVLLLRALIPVSQSQHLRQPQLIIPELKRLIFAYLASLPDFSGEVFTFEG